MSWFGKSEKPSEKPKDTMKIPLELTQKIAVLESSFERLKYLVDHLTAMGDTEAEDKQYMVTWKGVWGFGGINLGTPTPPRHCNGCAGPFSLEIAEQFALKMASESITEIVIKEAT